ncbi:hypothetical protein [Paenibacillus sp. NPDC057967]|uniref:hypothetical protein n=1 Tax=Paenibacillus sp. NPDC057967 TaxID=3346293 RepID=UPI0036DF5AF4
MAKVTHKLEFLVNAAEPVPEINNVILAFLQLHPGKESQILAELQTEIGKALVHYNADGDPAVTAIKHYSTEADA